MAPLSSDRGDFDAVTDINLLIEAVRVKLQRAKLNLRNSVEKWSRDSAIEGQHCNLREKGDSFFLKKDFNKALHCYRYTIHMDNTVFEHSQPICVKTTNKI